MRAVNAAKTHCDQVSEGIGTSQITYVDAGSAMFANVDGRQNEGRQHRDKDVEPALSLNGPSRDLGLEVGSLLWCWQH